MRGSRDAGIIVIPWIDRKPDHPFDPIARQAAAARSDGQGRPQRAGRSLALDHSEHGGRLSAFGRSARTTSLRPLLTRIMRTAVLCVMPAPWSVAAQAGPAVSSAHERASATGPRVVEPWATAIAEAARRFDLPERWIRAVMRVESGGDPRAVSQKGAVGLMQIMPATWTELRSRHGLGDDPFDPHDNIIAGAAYLREMHDRYGAPGFLAAYNAGPARYEEHRLLGIPLPGETRAYFDALAPIIGSTAPSLFAGSGMGTAGGAQTSLFAIDTRSRSGASPSPPRTSASALFATVKPRAERAEQADSDHPNVQTK